MLVVLSSHNTTLLKCYQRLSTHFSLSHSNSETQTNFPFRQGVNESHKFHTQYFPNSKQTVKSRSKLEKQNSAMYESTYNRISFGMQCALVHKKVLVTQVAGYSILKL